MLDSLQMHITTTNKSTTVYNQKNKKPYFNQEALPHRHDTFYKVLYSHSKLGKNVTRIQETGLKLLQESSLYD